jgi:hypothetical protein
MPTRQKETQKRSVIFTRKNMNRVYFDTQMLPRVAHTFTKNVACVFYKVQFLAMVKNQMQDDECVL